ncbi:MAG: bifunctional folylpolyglutamate synthase/dihydrofolate synthase [candidate division WOR-3 bacterium]|nr:bifunctional folylpolyglutamate synthase/dihydrofolate synthase [candidate division WOR-3 bacterium]
MTYSASLAFLNGLVNYERQAKPRTKFKLDNIRRLLELAGNPQERMPNVILVAGTKGKGSVCYMLDAALRGCGLSTGMFISPHVLDVRERIQLDGKPIPKRLFARLVSRLSPFVSVSKPSIRHSDFGLRHSVVPVSYFEMTTAMAFLLFAEKQPDYSIVEVGLGGRLDATNLSDPKVSVITRIGYDHLKVLGNTLTKIAGEKAGIMRKGRPVVISEQEPEALTALKRKAGETGARLRLSPSVVSVQSVLSTAAGTSFRARCRFGSGAIRLPLLGQHQVENCQTALAVLGELAKDDSRIKFNRVARGLKTVSVPARCQVVGHSSLLFPHSSLLCIVDSCHNPESGRALANVLRDHLPPLRTAVHRAPHTVHRVGKVILVYGSLSGKLVAKTVAPLAPFVQQAVLVQPNSPRAMPLPELSRIFSRLRVPFITADSVRSALSLARNLAQAQAQTQARSGNLQPANCKLQTPAPIIVAGSFYLAGDALKALGPAREDRKGRTLR